MGRFILFTLFLLGLFAVACSGGTPATIEEEMKNLEPIERQALTELLKGTGLAIDQLRPIGIRGIDRNAKSVALDGKHIVGVRLTGVTVLDLTPLQRMPALKAVWLTECALPNLAGLSGISTLQELSLAKSGLTVIDGLANLPQLKEINLDDNKLKSLSGLKALQSLRKVSARNNQIAEMPTLDAQVVLALEGNPIAQPAAATPAIAEPTLAANATTLVSELPKGGGKTTGKGPHFQRGSLTTTTPFERSGRYDSLIGAYAMLMLKAESADPTADAEVSVEQGRVRIYLEDQSRKGYRYAEATPGQPARFTGRLIYHTGYFGIMLESVDGGAQGIRYRVTRAAGSR